MKSLITNFLLAYGQEAFPEEREHFSFVKEKARLQNFSRGTKPSFYNIFILFSL